MYAIVERLHPLHHLHFVLLICTSFLPHFHLIFTFSIITGTILQSSRLLAALGSEKVLECECTENVDLLVDTDFIGWVVLNSKRKSANLMNKSFLADFMHVCIVSTEVHSLHHHLHTLVHWYTYALVHLYTTTVH